MGVNKREQDNRLPRRIAAGPGNGSSARWDSVPAETIRLAISAASAAGGALRFGYTRDGGAYAIGVYGDGDPYTLYCKPSEDPVELLRQIADGFLVEYGAGVLKEASPQNGHKKAPPTP